MEIKGLYPSLSPEQAVGSRGSACKGQDHVAMSRSGVAAGRRRRTRKVRWMVRTGALLGVFAVATILFALAGGSQSKGETYDAAPVNLRHRRLLSTGGGNMTHSGIESCEYEKAHLPALFVVVYAILVLIFFISLAIICDDFFVPSLEAISERLELSEDVAGATFMAAGSSAPELFTSLAGVSVESDVGVGTIVGSALFNILIIIALSAALAGEVLQLDWRPLLRDSIYYGLSIACFIAFSWDGIFEIHEAIILLVLYGTYILLMKFNSTIMDLSRNGCRRTRVEPIESGSSLGDVAEEPNGNEVKTTAHPHKHASHTDRRGSVVSTASGGGLSGKASSKHIFHHVKHGELASSFTSSLADVKRPGDVESHGVGHHGPHGPHGPQMGSRVGSLAGSIIIENSDESGAGDRQQQQHGRPRLGSDAPHRDAHSLGGVSGEFGSRSHLHIPFSGFNDADSGIHSAQGPTPVNPDPSHPSYHSDHDPSDPKASKRHSISIVHHEHPVIPAIPSVGQEPDKPEIVEEDEVIDEEMTLRPIPCLPAISMYYPDKEVLQTRCGCVRYALKWLMFFVSFPFMCAFTWTIPNCSNPKYKRLYMLSFTMSIAWIALLSFAMVTIVSKVGCILYIDAYTMGLVVVAIGTSVPDALSSVLVARDGFGDMAVSNAIGSNVFDINLGLGLPFLISILIFNQPLALLTPEEFVLLNSGALVMTPHAKFGFILLAVLFMALFVFTLVRFKLNKVVGISFVIMYIVFLAYAIIQEMVCNYTC